jgi:hypothetical protein
MTRFTEQKLIKQWCKEGHNHFVVRTMKQSEFTKHNISSKNNLGHKKWELRYTAFEKRCNSSPITMSPLATYYLGIPAITMEEKKSSLSKFIVHQRMHKVIVLKAILKSTLK